MTRDSILLTLGVVLGLLGYLAAMPPPWDWTYYQWIASLAVVISTGCAKYSNSPLLSGAEKSRVNLLKE